jgi:thiol-disulfide isomerase/thioredoxin
LLACIGFVVMTSSCVDRNAPDQTPVQRITVNELKRRLAHPGAPLTLVHVWATWCAPCRQEFPVLVQVEQSLAGSKMAVMLISADDPANTRPVRQYLAKQGARSPSFVIDNPNQAFIEALSTNWSGALPASFFFGPAGELLNWWEGPASYDQYIQAAHMRPDTTKQERL